MAEPPGQDRPPAGADAAEREFARGLELHRRGELDAARRAYARALAAAPGHTGALNNLGAALRAQGRRPAAVAAYRRGLAVEPDNASLHANLGNVLRDLGRPEEAFAHQQRAVELAPEDAGLQHGLGLLLGDLGRAAEAVRALERALQMAGEAPAVAADLGQALVAGGDLARGFRLYEARRRLPGAAPAPAELPAWDGGEAKGRRLLLWDEGRDEDAIVFVRYARLLAERGAEPYVACRGELARLLASAPGVAGVAARGGPLPRAEAQAPLASLPALLGATRESLPPGDAYLAAPRGAGPPLTRPAGARLAVGLAWAGAAGDGPGLAALLALLERPRVAFYAVQKGPAAVELLEAGAEGLAADAGGRIEDLADMAGAVAGLDLVIAPGGPVAALAAALGRPAWVLTPYAPDWRWRIGETDSPWFPAARLFRQPAPGDWAGAVAAVGAALDAELARRS